MDSLISPRRNNRFHVTDIGILIFLLLFIALVALKFFDLSKPPFEDAAILMRYAENFAQGHGIVWNIGDKPVDGATDFLFMISLGLLVKVGMSLEFAARFIGFSSHVVTVWIVYLSLRKLFHAHLLPALVTSLYLAVGPGLYYVATYFGTPFFALFACITWYFALTIILNAEVRGSTLLFVTAALITALIRPEGVILSSLMLLAIVYINGLRKSRYTVLCYLGIFLLFGGLYFLWRWRYFGFPLPNAFYKKGGGHIYPNSLVESIGNTIKLCFPFLPAFIIGLYSRKTLRFAIGFSIPIIGFASAFVLISNEMNWAARFQYALLPIVLMSWWPLIGAIKEDLCLPKWNKLILQKQVAVILLVMAFSVGLIGYRCRATIHHQYYKDGRYDIAVMLSEYRDKHFTIATTEAGLLPLYSHWKALDAWGLNDSWIAHNGGITEEYLARFKPHIIMFNVGLSPLVSWEGSGAWFETVTTLKKYAEKNGYVLAAEFGAGPYSTHYYYVRSDFPESSEIISHIQTMDYRWYANGRKSINYALFTAKQKQ